MVWGMFRGSVGRTDLGDTTPPAAPAATSYETIVLSSIRCKIWGRAGGINKKKGDSLRLCLQACQEDTAPPSNQHRDQIRGSLEGDELCAHGSIS